MRFPNPSPWRRSKGTPRLGVVQEFNDRFEDEDEKEDEEERTFGGFKASFHAQSRKGAVKYPA